MCVLMRRLLHFLILQCRRNVMILSIFRTVWYINLSNCHYFSFYRLFIYVVPKRVVKNKQTLQ